MTLEWSPGNGESLQESERPLRATGPDRKNVAVRWKALSLKPVKRFQRSGPAKRPALSIAVLSTVHAGGEQGWKSGHLEPFSFSPHQKSPTSGKWSDATSAYLDRHKVSFSNRSAGS